MAARSISRHEKLRGAGSVRQRSMPGVVVGERGWVGGLGGFGDGELEEASRPRGSAADARVAPPLSADEIPGDDEFGVPTQ